MKGIKQHDATDCAVACIVWIARWYGLSLPLVTVRQMCGATPQGTTIKGVLDGCCSIGLEARAWKSADRDVEALRQVPGPAILHLEKDDGMLHFVVLCAVNHKGFVIMDPAKGNIETVREEYIARQWSGYLVACEPGEKFVKGDRTVSPVRRIARITKVYGRQLALTTAASMLYIVLALSTSIFLQHIVDDVIPSEDVSAVAFVAAAMSLLAVLAFACGFGRIMSALKASIGIDYSLVTDYLHHLFTLPVSFFTLRGSGELASRVYDAMKIRSFIVNGISALLLSVCTLLVSFALMFTYYWKLALLMLMFIPLYTLVYAVSDKVNKKANRDMIEASAAFEERTVEGISAISTVKYMCAEKPVAARIDSQYARLCDKMYAGGRWAGLFSETTEAVSKALTITLLAAGSMFVLAGSLSVGELVSFYSMITLFSTPMGQLVGLNGSYTEAKVSAERLFEIMDFESERQEGADPAGAEGPLVFRDVSFSYPGCSALIEHFDATFEPGKITAVTGDSGCGKSTLAALAMRGYGPVEGSITLGGVDISLFGLPQWRRRSALVPQESVLLNATVMDNITGGEKDPDMERIAELLVSLDMQGLVASLPMGLLTRTGERGASLSGGQKQRIALARALYRKPKMLILDEATSSLDSACERTVLDTVRRLADDGMTVIMITHKKDNLRIADKIIDMSARSEVMPAHLRFADKNNI
ncbi:MAG: peptidase domain-containing ABC transporter [Bacteroidales bacterium]|nr:peptidase domain-containing ABC transporter [Bacteroidales bacterium]